MKQFLIVVDMQNDFVSGSLGSPAAEKIVPAVTEKIRGFSGQCIATLDTHPENYLETSEGRHLPVKHCIRGTDGWRLDPAVLAALEEKGYRALEKPTFGSTELPGLLTKLAAGEEFSVELIGLCTDICVVSNALLLKANFPEAEISVDAACCAGVSEATHLAALDTMACCQIGVRNR